MRFAILIGAAIGGLSCTYLPEGRYALNQIEFSGNKSLGDDDIEEQIASAPTPKFLAVFRGVVYDYKVFDRYVLERDLERIERYYRARGFYRARVRAARVFYSGRATRVWIAIEEGPPVLLRRFDVHGLEALPADVVRKAEASVAGELSLGSGFQESEFESAERELVRTLENAGYAYVEVRRSADVDLPNNVASAGFWVDAGPRAEFGDVRIVGLGSLPEGPMRRAIGIAPGDAYSRFEIEEAKRTLLELGVFSAVDIEPDFTRDPSGARPRRVDLRVKVEPSKLRSVRVGGGLQTDTLTTNVHVLGGWEDANFLGGFRHFQLEAMPGVVLYPTRIPSFQAPDRLLPQGRLRLEFRQPGFIEARSNALVRAQASMYPVLPTGVQPASEPLLGYRDVRTSFGIERSFWKLYALLSYNFQVNVPFAYIGPLDANLSTAVISYPELLVTLDLRDNPVEPHRGVFVSSDTQVAGLGGDARDLKLTNEARGYVTVPFVKKLVVAARANMGLLFAQNYGGTTQANADGTLASSVPIRVVDRDVQLMFLRGFFAGGPGSNRGYGLREIGPHGTVPFYNPGQSTPLLQASCDFNSSTYSASLCDLPIGGFTLWEASLEFRYALTDALTLALFTDGADVAPRRLWFRWDRPHLSVGLGLRYQTPVGPVRFDLGYRVPGAQAPAAPDEGHPAEILGLPIAASFGIGESF